MIKNGSEVSLIENPGTLPNMESTLLDWFQKLTFTQVEKNTIDFKLVEVETSYDFMGVRQPFTVQQLMMKPEGQRKWKWEMIHALPDLVLEPDEIITFLDQNYRVDQKLDYKEYGYVEYHIVQDYQ